MSHGRTGIYLPSGANVLPETVDANQVSVAAYSLTAASTPEGTLVTITFEVVAVKASTLTLSEVIVGSGGTSVPVNVENGEVVEPPATPWDVNDDGKVNILDMAFVASKFGEVGPTPADVNRDGKVNILDLSLVALHFGE